eukprot:COSAG04_NODE_1758_length_5668_cov_2.648411_2_plen_1402_part_00
MQESAADNFRPTATVPDTSCAYSGCTRASAPNYSPQATQDDGSCDFGDKAALLEGFVMDSECAATWARLRGWNETSQPCQGQGWEGVSCRSGRVTLVDLDSPAIRSYGVLGFELGAKLSELGDEAQPVQLHLSGTGLSGTLPNLGTNNIWDLQVSETKLSGTVPSDIRRLRRFWAHNTLLSGSLPTMAHATSLGSLDLSGCRFTELPTSLPGTVHHLSLKDNPIRATAAALTALIEPISSLRRLDGLFLRDDVVLRYQGLSRRGTRVAKPAHCNVGEIGCAFTLYIYDTDDERLRSGNWVDNLTLRVNCTDVGRCGRSAPMKDNLDGSFTAAIPPDWVQFPGPALFHFFHGDTEFMPNYADGDERATGRDCKGRYGHTCASLRTIDFMPRIISCPPGYHAAPGSDNCIRCASWAICPGGPHANETFCPGGQTADPTQTECQECSYGKAGGGHRDCRTCVSDTMPNADRTDCECLRNYYNASRYRLECVTTAIGFSAPVRADQGCKPCPSCASCRGGTSEPRLKEGFVEFDATLSPPIGGVRVAYQCDLRSGRDHSPACQGGSSSNSTKHGPTAWPGCATGYAGHFCQTCAKGHHYVDQKCVPCDAGGSASMGLLMTVVSLMTIAMASVHCWRRLEVQKHKTAQPREERGSMAESMTGNPVSIEHRVSWSWEKDKTDGTVARSWVTVVARAMFQPLRMVITWAQVTSQIGGVLHIHYPPLFAAAVHALAFLRDAFSLFLDAECVGLSGFVPRWVLKVTVIPLLCVVGVACAYLRTRWKHDVAAARQQAKSYLFGCVFLLYPMICNQVFAAFECRRLMADGSGVVLEADDRLLCDDDEMLLLRSLSLVVIAVFGAGVPLGFGVFLVRTAREYERTDVDTNAAVAQRLADEFDVDASVADFILRDVTVMGQDFSFLMDAYAFRHYYWEALDLLRKLLLVGLVLLVGRGTVAQNIVAQVLSFGFFALQVSTKPFKLHQDNVFRATTEIHVFLVIATSLALRSDLSNEDVSKAWYDWGLFVSFLVLVPGAFTLAVYSKVRASDKILSDESLRGSFNRLRFGLATDDDRTAVRDRAESLRAAIRASSDELRRIVVSCPELATMDPEGRGPYDQLAMEKVKHLQQQGIVKMAFDRAGTSTARAEDVPLFEAGDAMKIKETVWFYGYTTAVKRCISLELQNFRGTLELICVDGGPVTQVEAQEMPRIVAEALHDAEVSGIYTQCEVKILQMSFHDLVDACKRLEVAHEQAASFDPVSLHKAVLNSVPLFRSLTNSDVQKLAESLTRTEILAGDAVIKEGESGDLMFVVEAGHLVASTEMDGVVKEYANGTFFGELALVNDEPRKATVTATRDSVLLGLGRPAVHALLTEVFGSKAAGKASRQSHPLPGPGPDPETSPEPEPEPNPQQRI